MKAKFLLLSMLLGFCINPFKGLTQAINPQDSVALVDFYHNTSNIIFGSGDTLHIPWHNETNWLTAAPVSTWYGVTVTSGRVTKLVLNNNGMIGGLFPASFVNLSKLADLELVSEYMRGPLPSLLGNLTELTTLNLNRNHFTGSIPASFTNLTKLHRLDLGLDVEFTQGDFPMVLTGLTNLDTLVMNYTGLTGNLPPEIGNLIKLRYLDLSHNSLTGTIPASMVNCRSLYLFHIYSNNLSGTFPGPFLSLPNIVNDAMNFGCYDNNYTFDAIEQLMGSPNIQFFSSIQKKIPLTSNDNLLSVSAGGTLSKDSFFLYRDSMLYKTQIGDSMFTITNTGKYYILARDANLAPFFTLNSDTVSVKTNLPNTGENITKNITGTAPTDINNGLYKLANLQPSGTPNNLSGNVTVSVAIDNSVQEFNHQPFVQRHYDIQPAVNAAAAEATVTLYFTQNDFDNFNAYITANSLSIPLLPAGGVDNGNVRIIQLHGAFSGSSDPTNYTGTAIFITPNVSWNSRDNWWVVSFPVHGFSGFFVSTINFALPLSLLEFKGKSQENLVSLSWLTTNEKNTKEFVIERADGNNFKNIGKVTSLSAPGTHQYNFQDLHPTTGSNLYRLKMIDIDGKFTYSNVVSVEVKWKNPALSVYPNPTLNIAAVSFISQRSGNYLITVTDNSGKIINRISGISVPGANRIAIDLSGNAAGIYLISLTGDTIEKNNFKLVKE